MRTAGRVVLALVFAVLGGGAWVQTFINLFGGEPHALGAFHLSRDRGSAAAVVFGSGARWAPISSLRRDNGRPAVFVDLHSQDGSHRRQWSANRRGNRGGVHALGRVVSASLVAGARAARKTAQASGRVGGTAVVWRPPA